MCGCVHTKKLVWVFFSVRMAQKSVGKIKRQEGMNMSACVDLHYRMEVKNLYIYFSSQ